MKRFLIFCLVGALLLLCACQSPTPTPKPDLTPDSGPAQTQYDIIKDKAESDLRYRWIKAFLDHDEAVCADLALMSFSDPTAELQQSIYDWYEYLDEISFGRYQVSEPDESTVLFEFFVRESGYDVFPAGKYAYHVYQGLVAPVEWKKVQQAPEVENQDALALLNCLVPHVRDMDALTQQTDEAKIAVFNAIRYFHEKDGGDTERIAKRVVEEGARALFGLDEFAVPDSEATANGDYYEILGHGGTAIQHEITKVSEQDGMVELTVQFFADNMNTVKSYLVRYTFAAQEGSFSCRLTNVERLEDGVFSPYQRIV